MTQLRAACTLYLVTPGDDREEDVCIGSVASAELAALIVAAVNGAPPAIPRCPTPCDDDCEQPCHEVHDVPSHREHGPERCVAALAEAARRNGARTERERIRALAVEVGAHWWTGPTHVIVADRAERIEFADLIIGPVQANVTEGD